MVDVAVDATEVESGSSREQRLRSVLSFARQAHWEERHSRHVTALALSLFDQLGGLHGLDGRARELLQWAGYLHDVGYLVSPKGHHKHSYRLISSAYWPHFEQWEVQAMAAIARYHRKRRPRDGDQELAGLSRGQKRMVRLLAAILRVADGMDRTHLSMVRRVRARVENGALMLGLVSVPGAELELHYALEKSDLLAAELGVRVKARLVPLPEAADGS